MSSADIANNLGNMSAVMAQTGATFEQSLGMLTAITEVTRVRLVLGLNKQRPNIYKMNYNLEIWNDRVTP